MEGERCVDSEVREIPAPLQQAGRRDAGLCEAGNKPGEVSTGGR